MSPRTEIQNEEIRTKSKNAILHAAFALFAQKGYEKTSIAQIAKEAGISKGLVYNYFESKEDLLKGIFHMMVDQFDSLWEVDEKSNPKEVLQRILDYTFNFLETHSEFSRLLTMLALQKDVMNTIRPMIEEIRVSKMKFIIPIFEDLGFKNPETEAYFLGSILDGIAIGLLAEGDDYPYQKMKQRVYEEYQLEYNLLKT